MVESHREQQDYTSKETMMTLSPIESAALTKMAGELQALNVNLKEIQRELKEIKLVISKGK